MADYDKGAPRDPITVEDTLWADAKGSVGYDVGSNMGQSVAKMIDVFGTVLAFEPAQESYGVLTGDWGEHPRVQCHQVAVSDHDGELRLAIRQAPIMTGQLTAVDMPYHGEHMGEPGMANWGSEIAQRHLPCKTLDTLVAETGKVPDFVKVDTEGHEYQALCGATDLLRDHKPRWLIEFHTQDLHDKCVALLESHGYEVETVRHPHYPEGSHMYWQHGWLRAATPDSTWAQSEQVTGATA